MKKYIIAGLLAFSSQAALAQSWDGPGQQPVSYPNGTGGAAPPRNIGDGSNSHGGTPPAYSNDTADISDVAAGYSFDDWAPTTGLSRIDADPNEEKVRFVCNSNHAKQEDPILFHGQANSGHWHEFVGNFNAGKDSNYTNLRMSPGSSCPGGPVNSTAYWHPAMMKTLSTGVTAIIRSDQEVFYYTHASGTGVRKVHIPNDYAFIGGVDPSDPTNTRFTAEIPAGYQAQVGQNGTGFLGWSCISPGGVYRTGVGGATTFYSLKNSDGSDPWQGNCVAGDKLEAQVVAPSCWDGKNSNSPDGRSHVRYPIRHSNSGQGDYCPDGWWQTMAFVGGSVWTVGTGGFADYGQWFLSSDRHGLTEANWRLPGSTFHFDWMNGWEPQAIKMWEAQCGGVTNTGITADPGACDSATIGTGRRLWSNGEARPSCTGCSTLSNNPVTNLSITHWNDGVNRFYPVSPGSTGDGHLHHGVPPQ